MGTVRVSSCLLAVAACAPAAPGPVAAPILVADVAETPPPIDAAPPRGEDDATPAATSDGGSAVEAALREWSARSQCASFDYFPRGGIQSFWCHRPSSVTLAAVRALAGVEIFASGPHTEGALVLDAPQEFGHYDPAFVRWLMDAAAPSPRGSAGQRATQASYDRHMKPLAEIFWKTLTKARAEPVCFAREKKAYADLIAKKKLPRDYYERWFYFMNPYFCIRPPKQNDTFYFSHGFDAGVNGNVTKSVVGFWLRRAMDGTMDGFAEGLKALITSYQPELLDTGSPQAP
jgi:hypothetical protein